MRKRELRTQLLASSIPRLVICLHEGMRVIEVSLPDG